ncbi:MAG: glycoside hydrolase family 5 protein [Bacteroidales bacterium]|nr:glycoside hydrolase family 5 protein [Bacteroidales bacterium]
MRFILSTVLLAGLLACQTESIKAQNPDSVFPTAKQWNEGVVGWNLGNQLECSAANTESESFQLSCIEGSVNAETAWGNPRVTAKVIKAVKEAGFNAVRIPVRWQCHITNANAMSVDKEWVSRVKEVIDYCLREDMKVILNTHHDKWLEGRPTYEYKEENCRKLALLWMNIASEFGGYDERVAFAGTNEVHIRDNWGAPTAENLEVQNAYNQTFVDIVRSTGGKNLKRHLLVQTYVCNPDFGLDGQMIIPKDLPENGNDYMSVEFHYYQPWDYAGLGTQDIWNDEATLRAKFDKAAAQWGEAGLGVVIGEWGVTDHRSSASLEEVHENITYYCRVYVSEAMKRGFSTFVWDNNTFGLGMEKYGIFNRFKGMKVQAPWVLKGIMEGAGKQ